MASRRSTEHLPLTPEAFGWLLRDWREFRKMKIAPLARLIPCDASLLSRFEAAERFPREDYVVRLDELLEAGGFLLRAWRDVDWDREVVHPDWFKLYARLEAAAVLVRGYDVERIRGLLQTPEYARALFRFSRPDADEREIAASVAARMSRQKRFLVKDGPQLVAVLDEATLWRPVGGLTVMREQLQNLLDVGEHCPNVIIQVAHFGMEERTGMSNSLTLLTLPGAEEWAYSETMSKGYFVTDSETLKERSRFYDRLRAEALSAPDSARLIRAAMRGFYNVSIPRQQQPVLYSHRKADWRTSSYSGGDGGECVEVALNLDGVVPVRDSKDRQGPALAFDAQAWAAFTRGVVGGEFGAA
ncbi:Scr1 family TA system antitoxin-like transcriptional regulator [Kitasatospora sp. NBC_01287]|uniref:Scr1 family TA system antitoxin-like transcriptional regulator n=1 Tax=Kitasatospora sp. NBC_01287 TaxID=2903573 RepID=UPI00225106C7|nr:Scr1 family TA system antitoxin-like transcriptional regulator [Kitasatospora sp. NBC_01287]MCX4749065.1 Scr1 family TA system antitoxin-like transcriptional regulator [Kitasatospora sp. NBC_01287]